MAIVADTYTYVVGVDTHAATHHYAIVETRSGGQIAHGSSPPHAAGLLRAVDWISRRTSVDDNPAVDQVLISMEGTGSYGAQAAELLAARGYRVVDAPSPKRARGSGKNDHIDALVAARGALPKDSERLADRRAGHTRAALQILLTARDSMRRDRTRPKNQSPRCYAPTTSTSMPARESTRSTSAHCGLAQAAHRHHPAPDRPHRSAPPRHPHPHPGRRPRQQRESHQRPRA